MALRDPGTRRCTKPADFYSQVSQTTGNMPDDIPGKVQGILVRPLETFRATKEEDVRPVVRYFLVILAAGAFLAALVSLFTYGSGWGLLWRVLEIHHPVLVFFLMLVGGLVLVPLFSFWLHLWVRILGGRKGFSRTLKAVMYGATPGLLFGWIPVIGVFSWFWVMVLVIFGVSELQDIGGDRAAFAVVVAVIILLVVLALAAAWFLAASAGALPVTRAG